ncbi:conserved hypothetical protein [Amycolatopsis xylanica]|uniref:DUF4440 domain-containing protein n=1 Tax=Amycolatopsis xylanica TaxID=589385 RepID=A0A1H3GI12_9PSEU|nr:SgcJ/EcaC family oxidoreductase [Amycolatopsis xylanica]SDY02943.1 conserved hypothetical protein [Amycolatopsis xylanica]
MNEIKALFDTIYTAWADNDADAFAEVYREDATVTMPGVFHQGRAAIHAHMKAGFAGPLRGSRGIDEPQDTRILGNTAVVVSKAGIIMAGETEVPAERERRATWVLSKEDGRWLVAAYSNTPA